MTERFPITREGLEKMEKECHTLKAVERPAIVKAIAEARAHGDLSENAEYHAAKEKQSFNESKIKGLEAKISHAQVLDITNIDSSHIQFGAVVKFVDEDTEKELQYQIVSEYESDSSIGLISHSSPVARAAMGKKVGDSIEITTPGGIKYYEVLEITYK